MTSGVLFIMSPLDREKAQDYMLNITACDQGSPQKCTSILSQVIIMDENDNATDLDSGVFGQVTYVLGTETEDFSLDPKTGVLIVSRELDRESQEFYDLTQCTKPQGLEVA